jgi:hypothetical protein
MQRKRSTNVKIKVKNWVELNELKLQSPSLHEAATTLLKIEYSLID